MKIKVAILHPILAPYRIPLFEGLASDPHLDIKVFLDLHSNPNRPFWGSTEGLSFKSEIVKAVKVYLPWRVKRKELEYSEGNYSLLPLRLPFYLNKFCPDIIISTELGIRTWIALGYAKLMRKKILIWSDEYLIGLSKYANFRPLIRKVLVKMVNGFCSCGIENKKYLQFLGASSERIFNTSIAIENSFFSENATRESRKKVREDLQLNGTVFFNIGQIIGRKGIDRLLKVWATLPDEVLKNSTLLIVGGGEDKEKVMKLSKSLKLSNVVFVPPKPWAELPSYYAAGDIFIFPTLEDAWGLVVNEAMACGKPILCSKYAGCCPELIKEGENGYSFDPLNKETARAAIINMCEKEKHEIERMGQGSKEIVSEFTNERMIDRFKKVIYYCLEQKPSVSDKTSVS